jgi:hypothetical protein
MAQSQPGGAAFDGTIVLYARTVKRLQSKAGSGCQAICGTDVRATPAGVMRQNCRPITKLAAHNTMREPLVLLFHDGATTSLSRCDEHSFSTFGGPLETQVASTLALARPLHHIATVNHNQLSVLGAPRYVWEVPLVYGLFYSGCVLKYSFERASLNVEEVEPSIPNESWPYANYPVLLPYAPLGVASHEPESWDEFSRRAPNLPEEQPSELVVLVPPPATLGFSMWGRGGDAEGVTLVFECSLERKRVVAYNVCG